VVQHTVYDRIKACYSESRALSSPPASTLKPTETLSGQVERVTFHSAESGFCVLKVKVKGQDDLLTVVGFNASAMAGEHIEATGQWVNDREHGLQFKAQSLRSIPPTTLEGMEKYLGSGLIKGIGPHFAGKLVKAFGSMENYTAESCIYFPGF
jgi:exodeoxyribonuclease V alpha subunit